MWGGKVNAVLHPSVFFMESQFSQGGDLGDLYSFVLVVLVLFGIASSISASVVNAPKLKRTEERSRDSGTPIAISVADGVVAPLAQAGSQRDTHAGEVKLA